VCLAAALKPDLSLHNKVLHHARLIERDRPAALQPEAHKPLNEELGLHCPRRGRSNAKEKVHGTCNMM